MKRIRNKKNFQGNPKNLFIAILVFIASIIFISKLTDYTRKMHSISYSSFLKKVENNEVKSIKLAGQEVTGFPDQVLRQVRRPL